jgi:hypothetical protein
MSKYSSIAALLAGLLLTVACGGTKSKDKSADKAQTTFDFGRSTTLESLYSVVSDMLNRYNYHRTQLGTPTLIETDWRSAAPDTTEAKQGISETRHKLVVSMTARRDIVIATLRVTNEARFGSGPWLKSNPSPEVVKTILAMQRQTKLELSRYIQQW